MLTMANSDYNMSHRDSHGRTRMLLLITVAIISLTFAGGSSVQAASLSIDHEARLRFDFGGMRIPEWSGGALVNFISNRTAAPILLSFDDQGNQLQAFPFTIPDAEMIDLDDIARSLDGSLAVCGTAFDHSGRGAGFVAVTSPGGDQVMVVRLYPYYPSRITVASDGTIWTAGLEVVNGKEAGLGVNPEDGVLRHFDRAGKLLGSFIPRSFLSSPFMAEYGMLRSANGRIGWYTGPIFGPGSAYYELLSDGTIRKYPSIVLNKTEVVTGLALTDNGSTYVTVNDTKNHTWRFLSIAAPDKQWTVETLPDQLRRADLYGGEGRRLAFHPPDHLTLIFADVVAVAK